ncbi:LuxR family transcriptional regulator [Sulfitobacter donghicola DSW-25 = KCTC 12864 = JCM 14565]|uniref:LuxR family transcriptional regulator n=1 Tax=Sulfitobacter donghicola DSW-25 = KCTC 12864 = JCM 14565 TaxID=1300350 RepID=A0A073III6_9RHOB|nr:LuxR family transcriptional regulator [Sulfitobacter donghicola DSW-25 = KCTC 12864 = JCM 14565]
MKEILIVEDISQARAFLVDILGDVFPRASVSEAVDLRSAIHLCERSQFDLALVDLQLPDGDGYSVLRKLAQTQDRVISIVTTALGSDAAIVAALSAGADGYVLKSDPRDMIASHIRLIPQGQLPLSPAIARRVLGHFRATGPSVDSEPELTPREGEVLSLVGRGMRVSDVAAELGLAPSTISSHVKAIYRKLNISNRAEAAYQAARMGFLTDE